MKQDNRIVLVCDDNNDSCELLEFLFKSSGFKVICCDNLDDCLAQAQENILDAVILDNRFGEYSSLEVSRQIRDVNLTLPIVFYSAEARRSEIDKAIDAGASAYLVKPGDFEKLTGTIINLIEQAEKDSKI